MIGTHELIDLLDHRVTYRQLDYWIRVGRIQVADSGHGSGIHRQFAEVEVEAIRRLVDLLEEHTETAREIRSGRVWARLLEAAAVVVLLVVILGTSSPRADGETLQNGRRGLSTALQASRSSSGDTNVIRAQYVLKSFGYSITVDGIAGPQTRRVVMAWQRSNRLPRTGSLDSATLDTLGLSATATAPAVRVDPPPGTPEEIIRQVWPDDLEEQALAIAHRESRFVPTARNACCYGLFQIHWGAHRGWLSEIGVTSPDQLLDPATNARAALALYERDGWSPWSL